jgi:hypothetical protein
LELLLLLLRRHTVCKQHVQQQVRMMHVLLVSVLLSQALLLWL